MISVLDSTDRVLLETWLTQHDGESAAEFAQALTVPTDVAIRVPVDPDDDFFPAS
jgi:hypothetical protein